MHLIDLLTPARIAAGVGATSKKRLLETVAGLLASDQGEEMERRIFDSLFAREKLGSTGLGHGVAIPHGKTSSVDGLVLVAGVAREGIDFEALDGEAVHLFFLLVGPESAAGQHVKALSRISRLLRRESFRQRLIDAPDPRSFYSVLAEAEAS